MNSHVRKPPRRRQWLGGFLVLSTCLLVQSGAANAQKTPPTDEPASAGETVRGALEGESAPDPETIAGATSEAEALARQIRSSAGRRTDAVFRAVVRQSGQAVSEAQTRAGLDSVDAIRYPGAFRQDGADRAAGPAITEERDAPDYDGIEERTTFLEVLAWPARVVFFPLFLTTEYLIRWPLGVVGTFVERHHLVRRTIDLFTWAGGDAGIYPIFDWSSGRSPTLGAALFWDDFLLDGFGFDAGIAGNTGRTFTAKGVVHYRLFDEGPAFRLRASTEQRDDWRFFGLGTQEGERVESHFFRDRDLFRFEFETGPKESGFGGWIDADYSTNTFGCSRSDEDICGPDNQPNTGDDLYPVSNPDVLSRFDQGYDLAEVHGRVYWDSREPRPAAGTGMRLEALGGWGRGIGEEPEEIEFLRYGAEASLFWDVFGFYQRTLGLRLRADFVDEVEDRSIPFSELVEFGGIETMRGFHEGRFRGRSGVLATLDYRYPVWSFAEGVIFADLGNVFGPGLEGFEFDLLRGAFGLGLRTFNVRDTVHVSYELNASVGTTAFRDGFSLDEFQVNFGTNWGF